MKTTKELAKELGLLRKRSVSSPGQKLRNKRRKVLKQIFQYIIVLDFESTCWSDTKLIPQEIIEFPAVLMNITNGSIESEFQYYVQPQEKPMLSEFCCELTGITQKQVDDGIPLQFCLKRFSQWLEKLYKEKNIQYFSTPAQNSNLCCFITWSDWDLGMCLKNECRRKQIRKPPELNQWIDLRATYKKFYGRKPEGLNGALKDLGITFQGREHSGLDDARNTAFLAWRMVQDGCILTITKSLTGVPKSDGNDKQSEKCSVVKEMPTVQYGDQVKNLGKNNNFKTGLPILAPLSNIGHTMNTSDKNKKLPRNSPPKRPKSPFQSKLHKNSDLPQTSLEANSSIGQKMNASDKNGNLTRNSPPKRQKSPLQSRLHKNSDLTKIPMNSKCLDKRHTLNSNQSSISSTATRSKSTSFNTALSSFQHRTQSNQPQPKKQFTVYTDIKNPDPKTGQASTQNIYQTRDKTPNCSTTVSTPCSGVKDISNTFITPSSLPPRKSNSGATFKYPNSNNNNPSKMKSTPPLCKCGRRAKLSVSHSPGVNMGKRFFTCSMKGSNIKLKNKPIQPCNFFKWDHVHQSSSISLSNHSLESSSLSLSSFSISTKCKENDNSCDNSTLSLGTNSAENTPVLKKKPMRPYQLC